MEILGTTKVYIYSDGLASRVSGVGGVESGLVLAFR